MKIIVIHPYLFRLSRGIERYTYQFAHAMTARGLDVEILTWNHTPRADMGDDLTGIPVHAMPAVRYLERFAAIAYYTAFLLFRRFDWVLISFAGFGERQSLSLLRLVRKFRTCVVFQFPFTQAPHRYREFARNNFIARTDLRIAVSCTVARDIEEALHTHCHLVHTGVDPGRFQPSVDVRNRVRRMMGVHADTPVIIAVAALEPRKGMQRLVSVAEQLRRSQEDFQCWIVGEGPMRAQLTEQIRKAGLASTVRLLGNRNDVPDLMAAADLGCLLSRGEGFSLATLECMASGLPVVVTSDPPFLELVDPDCGLVINEEHDDEAVEAFLCLMRDRERREQMGKAARRKILARFTLDRTFDAFASLLQ